MKIIKTILAISLIGILAYAGIIFINTTGNIEIEINKQVESYEETARYISARKMIHDKDGFWDIQQSFYRVDTQKIDNGANFTITAKEGYSLVAYDKSKNILGLIQKIEIDDGGSSYAYADFDINNYIGQKYFYVVAEKNK